MDAEPGAPTPRKRDDGTTPPVSPGSLLVFFALPAGAAAVLFFVFGSGILVTFLLLCFLVALPIAGTRLMAGPPRKDSP